MSSCDCNDYSLLTADTGIALVSVANSNLDGTGAMELLLTGAGSGGTIVKSIIIKAIEPVKTGMIRLFIQSGSGGKALFREIPIPQYPDLPVVPYPLPIIPALEIDLVEEIKLVKAARLYVSTQTADKFNIIAEGLRVGYPDPVPDTCCSFKQEIPWSDTGTVSVANPNRDGSGDIEPVFTSLSTMSGTKITSITIAALQSTHEGMVRLFLSKDGGTTYSLMMEICIPESNQSNFQPSFKVLLEEDYYLASDVIIGASTQNAEKFAVTVEGTGWTYPS